jgi:SAM-dependent methyltransferase
MQLIDKVTLTDLMPRLRCPRSFDRLRLCDDGRLVSERTAHEYPIVQSVPDLMHPPPRLHLDLPWYEPWHELDDLSFERPDPVEDEDLPYHLDKYLAAVPGKQGDGRWILEVGCGERQCERYFNARGFRYVGSDADHRGAGPHVKADAHNLPFQDSSFDLYTSMAVYEHLASPLLAAVEAFRVLKPGGMIFGTAAFVYGFHDRASFNHMTHAGLLWTLRMAGFRDVRIWPDWHYTTAIPEMGFGPGLQGMPWRVVTRTFLKAMDFSFTRASNAARRIAGKKPLDLKARDVRNASSLTYVARKP